MARFGTWAPLAINWASQLRLTTPDIICVHTMVGSLAGTDAMFRRNGFGGTFSHFGIGGDGACIQWQDTAYRAAANYNGNHRIISVECADIGTPFAAWNTNDGSAVPAFSDPQVQTLAELIATIAPAHGIPIVLIPDALPGRRGVGYHRLGVPGYMVAGAEQWSTAQGKVCPGNRRIAQLPQVIATALNGDDDMPLTDDDAKKLSGVAWTYGADGKDTWPINRLIGVDAKTGTIDAKVDALAAAVAALRSATSAASQPVVNVDAAAVATALAGNQGFLAAVAKAVNDDAARRQAS